MAYHKTNQARNERFAADYERRAGRIRTLRRALRAVLAECQITIASMAPSAYLRAGKALKGDIAILGGLAFPFEDQDDMDNPV